jgi:hypothetical protein
MPRGSDSRIHSAPVDASGSESSPAGSGCLKLPALWLMEETAETKMRREYLRGAFGNLTLWRIASMVCAPGS